MKKINVLFLAIIAMALMMSCGGTPQTTTQANLPDWLNEIPPEDVIWGIGSAKLQNDNLAMQTATTRAQTDVARQINVTVQNMLTDYANEAGLIGNSRSMQAIESIGRNLVNHNLAGATPIKRDKMDDGTWWIRVSILKADAARQIHDYLNNEVADYAEFRAARALDQLDYQLQQTQSRPTVVSD